MRRWDLHPHRRGWLSLASVIDLASRHLLGWSMGDHHDAALVVGGLEAAVATRGGGRMDATIFPTDRGSEYTWAACIDACARLGLRRSMGRTGSCLDNAVAEGWFASLKVELVDRHHYRTRAEARISIFAWIHHDNRRRLHSTIGYLPPSNGNATTPLPTRYHRPPPHNPGVHLPGGKPKSCCATGCTTACNAPPAAPVERDEQAIARWVAEDWP